VAAAFHSMDYGKAPEADDTAKAWLASHGSSFGAFINGEWVHNEERETHPSTNPANGEHLADVMQANSEDVDVAIKAARDAQGPWAALPAHERAKYLYSIARHIQKYARLFAVLESMDNGKTIRETRDADIPLVVRHFYSHAGWAQLMDTQMADQQPVGVIGQVIPWNFPLLMLAWKIAPALAMGNTLVLKPAPATKLTALLFCEILKEVGLPAGVVNVVCGDNEMASHLATHPGIDKLAFTGSTPVGKWLRDATAGSGIKLSLELGGKSPAIVYESADLDSAIEGMVNAIFFNQGQVCCAGSRLLVQESVEEEFMAKLRRRMDTLRVGDPLDKALSTS